MVDTIKLKLLLFVAFGVIAFAVNVAGNSDKYDLLGSESDSSASNSSSTSEKCPAHEEWEGKGGFLLYFFLMAYIFVGFEVCILFFQTYCTSAACLSQCFFRFFSLLSDSSSVTPSLFLPSTCSAKNYIFPMISQVPH